MKRALSTASNGTKTPKKKAKENCPSGTVLRNLRKLAAFHCYVFMVEAYEKKKMSEKWKIVEEAFYGDPRKKIKGAIHQLIDGDNAFAALYDDPVVNEKGIVERHSHCTSLCCGDSFHCRDAIYLRRWKGLHWSIAVGIWRGGYEFGKKSHLPHAKTCSPDLLHWPFIHHGFVFPLCLSNNFSLTYFFICLFPTCIHTVSPRITR